MNNILRNKKAIRESLIEKRDYTTEILMKENKKYLIKLIHTNRNLVNQLLERNAELRLEINYLERGLKQLKYRFKK